MALYKYIDIHTREHVPPLFYICTKDQVRFFVGLINFIKFNNQKRLNDIFRVMSCDFSPCQIFKKKERKSH